jgi:hypothetical protein
MGRAESLNKTIREVMAFLGDDAARPVGIGVKLQTVLHENSPISQSIGTSAASGAATSKATRSSRQRGSVPKGCVTRVIANSSRARYGGSATSKSEWVTQLRDKPNYHVLETVPTGIRKFNPIALG